MDSDCVGFWKSTLPKYLVAVKRRSEKRGKGSKMWIGWVSPVIKFKSGGHTNLFVCIKLSYNVTVAETHKLKFKQSLAYQPQVHYPPQKTTCPCVPYGNRKAHYRMNECVLCISHSERFVHFQ